MQRDNMAAEGKLEYCLDSLLRQTLRDMEIIAVDDASTDASLEILRRYEEDHPEKIRVIHYEKNKRQGGAKNEGLKMAGGEWIGFLDSDDWWTEEKLKKQLALLNRTGGVLCSTAREFATHQGELTGIIVPVKPIITYRSLLYDNSINCSSVLMRTEIAREFPMLHDELHEDYITWLKILKKYKKAYAINEPLLKYRCSQGGKSSNKLKSAWMHYHSLRFVGIPPLSAFWHFLFYMVSGILKYRKVKRKR